jgi:hypothetical protein
MDVLRIEGCTRTIGESQGYIGLPLRDVVINDVVDGPQTPGMESAWALSEDELAAVTAGKPIILRVMGTTHPPVMLYVGSEPHPVFTEAARDVLKERARQIDGEGWTAAHDDRHDNGELSLAAAAYAEHAGRFADAEKFGMRYAIKAAPSFWPWWTDKRTPEAWNPKSPRRDLVRAAALLLAEIERLDRAAARVQP